MRLEYHHRSGWYIREKEYDGAYEIISPYFKQPEEALEWAVKELADRAGFVLEFDGPRNFMLREKYI